MPHFLHLGDKKKQTEIRTGKVHCSSSLYYSFSPFFPISRLFLLPSHRDARVQIVELGSAESNLLVLLTISRLHLQLHQLLFYPLNRLLLGLHSPAETSSTQGYTRGRRGRNIPTYQTFRYTHFLDFSSLRTLASALALFSSLLASESWSLLASI